MAKVIKFHVPKSFRNPFMRAAQPQRGQVIEFAPQGKKSPGVIDWHLLATESNRAVGSEYFSHPSSPGEDRAPCR